MLDSYSKFQTGAWSGKNNRKCPIYVRIYRNMPCLRSVRLCPASSRFARSGGAVDQHQHNYRMIVSPCVTTVRYGQEKVEVHVYSPASSRLSGLNVRVATRDIANVRPTSSQRNVCPVGASRSSPLTSHVKE